MEEGGISGFIGNNEIRIGKKEFCLSNENFKDSGKDLFYKCEFIEIKEEIIDKENITKEYKKNRK